LDVGVVFAGALQTFVYQHGQTNHRMGLHAEKGLLGAAGGAALWHRRLQHVALDVVAARAAHAYAATRRAHGDVLWRLELANRATHL
jgi:hypothetical protein